MGTNWSAEVWLKKKKGQSAGNKISEESTL